MSNWGAEKFVRTNLFFGVYGSVLLKNGRGKIFDQWLLVNGGYKT